MQSSPLAKRVVVDARHHFQAQSQIASCRTGWRRQAESQVRPMISNVVRMWGGKVQLPILVVKHSFVTKRQYPPFLAFRERTY